MHSANGGVLENYARRPIVHRPRWILPIVEMVKDRLRRGRGVFQIQDAGLFGAAQGIVYSAHLVP
jgi:hypothetical protein